MWHLLVLAAQIPDPPPAPPTPELSRLGDLVIGGMKWFGLVGGVLGFLICALMIMVGRRNRNQIASDGLNGTVWVIAGLALMSMSASLVALFV